MAKAKPVAKKVVAKKAAPRTKKVAPQEDAGLAALLDIKPTPAYPGMYIGKMGTKQCLRAALAYHRDENSVWTIMFSDNGGSRVTRKFSIGNFDATFERAHLPHRVGPIYPIEKGIQVFLKP